MQSLENRLADEEWNDILKKVCPRHKIKQSKNGNFLDSYFETLEDLVNNIRSNPYVNTNNEDDKKKLQKDLYDMYSLFVCYHYIMLDYAKYESKKNNKEGLDFEYPQLKGFFNKGFPCSHNFNKYLMGSNGYPFSPWLYEKYYKLVVDVVYEFCKSKGKVFPKYLYNLSLEINGFLTIQKLEYFDWDDIPHTKGANLNLPDYHQVNGKVGSLEDYRKLYEKWLSNDSNLEYYWNRFLEREWPILEWIKENRTPDLFKDCHISHRDNSVCSRHGLGYLLEHPLSEQWIKK